MHVRTCTRRPLVCLPPPARRRPSHRGRPRWLHPAVRRAGAAPFSCPEPAATVDLVAGLLLEAAEIHARLTDGADPEWPSWFADWLVERAGLPGLLDTVPSRSELVYLLVLLGKETAAADLPEPWEQLYARRIVAHFAS
jgi:hypothetical protein